MATSAALILVALAVVLLTWLVTHHLVWRPYALGKAFRLQGIRGPAYQLFVGNILEMKAMYKATASDVLELRSHDILPRVLPQIQAWTASYGKVFLSWYGSSPMLCVGDYDMVKQILSNKTELYTRVVPPSDIKAMLGNGIVFTQGDEWVRRRRIVNPAFSKDNVRMMVKRMEECAGEVVASWEASASRDHGSVRVEDVGQQFTELTSDMITHATFGRDGKEVFVAQLELQIMAFASYYDVQVPGFQYLPTKSNVRRWQLEKKMRGVLIAIIRDRQRQAAASGYGNDLLGRMLASAGQVSIDDIIGECKTIFFAGHENTTQLLTWAVFLLATNPEWQLKLREEVLKECGGTLTGDTLGKLKLTTMVLYETLRLYGTVVIISRKATADTELGGLKIPKGTMTLIPIAMLHRDQQVWGADAGEFNPERFQDGVSRAGNHPSAFLAFSAGPRQCIGQDFVMLQAKATLCLILRRFEFTVAPDYVHAPADHFSLHPKFGLPILFKLIDQ